jgi:hypothetical protein
MSLVVPGGTITAGTGITTTTGNITATAGNITATVGNIIATAGNITASSGTGTFSALAVTGAITHTPIGSRFSASLGQLVGSGTETELTNAYWNTTAAETYAAGCTMNTSGRISFATPGIYLCTANLGFNGNINGSQRYYQILKNGSTVSRYGFIIFPPNTSSIFVTLSSIISITGSDYVSIWVYQDSGISLTMNIGSANQYSFFSVVKLT